MTQENLKDLKARLAQCNLRSPEVRQLLRGHVLNEKSRLGVVGEDLAGCMDAAAILIDSAGQMEEHAATEIQQLLLQLVDVVSEAQGRRTPGIAGPSSGQSSGIGVLNHMALGQVLVELGFVPREQVEAALGVATRSRRPIGEVLIEMGVLSEGDLQTAFSLQKTLTIHGAPSPASAPGAPDAPSDHAVHRILLGETLVAMGMIDRDQLEQGLRLQRRSDQGLRLGQALIQLGLLDETSLQRAIQRQSLIDASA